MDGWVIISIIKKWLGLTNIPGSLGSLMGNNSGSRKGLCSPDLLITGWSICSRPCSCPCEHRGTQVLSPFLTDQLQFLPEERKIEITFEMWAECLPHVWKCKSEVWESQNWQPGLSSGEPKACLVEPCSSTPFLLTAQVGNTLCQAESRSALWSQSFSIF